MNLAELLAAARADRAEVVPGAPTAPHYHYAFPHGSECTDWRCAPWVVEGLGEGWCVPGRHAEWCPMAGPA